MFDWPRLEKNTSDLREIKNARFDIPMSARVALHHFGVGWP